MRQFIFLIVIFPLTLLHCLAQDKSFRILSFTLDGKDVSEYTISFKVGDKQFIPIRDGDRVFVPKEVNYADDGITKFQSSGYTFELPLIHGYTETDTVKSDVRIGIDNYPFELEVSNPKLIKKFKTIYFVRNVPTVSPNSTIFINPSTVIVGDRKKKPIPTNRK